MIFYMLTELISKLRNIIICYNARFLIGIETFALGQNLMVYSAADFNLKTWNETFFEVKIPIQCQSSQ